MRHVAAAVVWLAGCGGLLGADAVTAVRLQLKWRHQFQFAGYYAAQAKGYYAQERLSVQIIEGGPTRPPLATVLRGEADFGVADSDVLIARMNGHPVVVCAAVFQHSPYVFLSRAADGIRTPAQLVGRRVMLDEGQGAAQFRAMLQGEGVDVAQVTLLPHSWTLDDLVAGRTDAISAYATVEPFLLRARGVEPAVLRALDYGVDFYGDTLFTTGGYIAAHPERAAAFVRASLRGWRYAMEHPEEIIDLILAMPEASGRGVTRELLRAEAEAMRDYILPEVVEIGHVNPGRWRHIADILVAQGIAPAGADLDGFLLAPDPGRDAESKVWLYRTAVGAAVVAFAALLVLLWVLQMRRVVAERTRSLREEIARREVAEQELRNGRDRLNFAQRVAQIGSWDAEIPAGGIRWSDETHRIFGTDPAAFAPTHATFLERVHPDDRAAVDAAFHASFHSDEDHRIEYRIVLPDRRTKTVEERWVIQRDAGGAPVRAVGTCQDITERLALESERRLLENSVARLNDIIIITDADQPTGPGPHIVFVNDAFERLTGYTRAEVLGRAPRMLQGPRTSREALNRIRDAIVAGRPVHEEIVNYSKDGREYWVDINISPVLDAAGRVTHFVAVERDVTERKKLEAQFLRAQRMESIGTLAGGIAHDLNNLLAPIIMGVDLLRHRDPRAEVRTVLDNMARAAHRGAELVRQVLTFARGVEGERVVVRAGHIAREIESMVANTFPKNIRFYSEVPQDLWTIVGDPTQLNQVLLNLCVNARDAMPKGGTLSLLARNVDVDGPLAEMSSAAAPGPHVCLEVTDTGCGMTREVLDRIFEPFFTTKPQGAGTGLGLSTVLGIVRGHGGFVNVYSEPGKGSTFKVYLPANFSPGASPGEGRAPVQLPRGEGELVLIVDDEAPILGVTRQTLEAFGYRVLTAEDGAQAIALFAANRSSIAALLTDMMMPVMDGPALIAAVRRIDPNLPIVASSGLASPGGMARIPSTNVKYFLHKPYNTELLLRSIRQAIDEGRRLEAPRSGT